MKIFKIFGVLLILVILLVGGSVWYLMNNYDRFIKTAVETEGPKVTGTAISLADVNFNVATDMTSASTALEGLVVGNPQGFDSSHLFKLGRIFLEIDPSTLTNDVIVIKNIAIDGVDVQVEQKGTTTNVQALMDNLKKKSGGSGSSASEESSGSGEASGSSETDSASQKHFMIENLSFTQGSLKLISEQLGERSMTMPEIKQSNLGDKQTGLTPEQLAKAILDPLLKNAQETVQGEIKNIATEKLEGVASEYKDKLNKELEEKAGSAVNVDDAKEKLQGLIGQ